MGSKCSVTTCIGTLELGDRVAAQALWERYFPRLIELARAKLRGTRAAAADLEDVALSAMHTLLRLEGHTDEEIAVQLPCSLRTVNRRLTLIRRTWEAAIGA
jgi:DNA-directed RNA polymerase specialized sigma24 family protein